MPHYVTLDDIRARFPQLSLTDLSKPTSAEVESWIDEVEAQLNAMLSNLGYTVPISNETDILILKDRVVSKIGGRVLKARLFGIGDITQSGSREAEQEYEKWLMALADPRSPVELTGSVRTRSERIKAGGVVRGYDPDASSGYVGDAPRATIGQVF